ncbi:MAG: hypothetical protein AAF570_16430, partial [Bacteroidota bacterium]
MSENPHINRIFSAEEEECLTLGQMTAYEEGGLEGEEKHYVERHLLNCELCSMAFEGIAEENAAAVAAGVADITSRAWENVAEQHQGGRRGATRWIAIAASVVLLITVGFFALQTETPSQDTFAQRNERSEEGEADMAGAERSPEEEKANDGVPTDAFNEDKKEEGAKADANSEDRFAMERPKTPSKDDVPLFKEMLEAADKEDPPPPPPGVALKDVAPADMNVEEVEVVEEEAAADLVAGVDMPITDGLDDAEAPNMAVTGAAKPNSSGNVMAGGGFDGDLDMAPESEDADDFAGIAANEREESIQTETMTEKTMDAVEITAAVPKRMEEMSSVSATTISGDDMMKTASGVSTRRKDRQGKKFGRKTKGLNRSKKKTATATNKTFADAGYKNETKSSKDADKGKPDVRSNNSGIDKGDSQWLYESDKMVITDSKDDRMGDIPTVEKERAEEEEAAPNFYRDGMDAYESGHYANSAALLRSAAAETPTNYNAHLHAAKSFLEIKQTSAAIYHLDFILKQPSNSLFPEAQYQK